MEPRLYFRILEKMGPYPRTGGSSDTFPEELTKDWGKASEKTLDPIAADVAGRVNLRLLRSHSSWDIVRDAIDVCLEKTSHDAIRIRRNERSV